MSVGEHPVYCVRLPGGEHIRHGTASVTELLAEYLRARPDDAGLTRVEVYELDSAGNPGATPVPLGPMRPERRVAERRRAGDRRRA